MIWPAAPTRPARHLARRLAIVSARGIGAVPANTSDWYGSFIAPYVLLRRDDGKALILRRLDTRYRDGWLCPLAGRIELSEDVLTPAIREVKEETGVTLRRDDAVFSHVMHRTASSLPGPCHVVSDYWFTFHHWMGEPCAAEPDKTSEALWIDLAAPPADMIPHCAQALAAIGRGKAFSEPFSFLGGLVVL